MRVLLSEGSGLTARQVATQLSAGGHVVEVLGSDRLSLTRFTSHVRRVHPVPAFGIEPFAWLDRALTVYREGRFDALVPTHEQVAILSRYAQELRSSGVATVVPPFEALAKVQDKRSAFATLAGLGIPQPSTSVVPSADELVKWDRLPAFVKAPIGTASNGVAYVAVPSELPDVAAAFLVAGAFGGGGVLVQAPAAGALVMVQSVFSEGRLIAIHCNLRVREGTQGGASHKKSIDLPAVREHVTALGASLGWNGALSADVVLTDTGPVFIDINPRLVEPGNAWRAGVDLVTPMLDLALARDPVAQPVGQAGVATHQLVLAVRAATHRRHPRRAVCSELAMAAGHRGSYRDSAEELTPLGRDARSALFVTAASAVLAIRPTTWRSFSSRRVSNYALSPAAWQRIVAGAPSSRPVADPAADRRSV